MRTDKGLFIVFEGIDGSGKSSMAKMLRARLVNESVPDIQRPIYLSELRFDPDGIILTREPTNGEYGEQIRAIAAEQAKKTKHRQVDPASFEMLDLFEKDRNLHVNSVIKPALGQGHIVICDRYFYSTVAYQGAYWNPKDPRGIPYCLNPANIMKASLSRFPVPDLVVIIDVPVCVALARIGLERSVDPMFEQESYLELVRWRFGQMHYPNIAHISGLDSMDRTFDKVWAAVEPMVRAWNGEHGSKLSADFADDTDRKR